MSHRDASAAASTSATVPEPANTTAAATPIWSEVTYYRPPSAGTSCSYLLASILIAVLDTELEPTALELKSTFLSSSRPPTGPDAPLLTAAARARLYPTKPKKVYTNVRLRLRFPDRSLLEALLPISATIGDVFRLLAFHLDPESRGKEAVLWQTMPRMEWRDNDKDRRTKIETLGWAPNAVVNVRFTDEQVAKRTAWVEERLRRAAGEVPVKSWEDGGSGKQAAAPAGGEQKKEQGKKLMPKWLKGIVKK